MIKQKALNILIVPGIFPFPPNAGGRICIYGFIEYLLFILRSHKGGIGKSITELL